MMKAIVHNSCCHIFRREQLPRGTVGKTMEAEFSADWDGLAITAVFEAGDVKMDRVYTGEPITIPHEVLATAGLSVMLGFHGALPDGTIVKRTVPEWLNNVRDSLDPSGAIGSDPTPDWTAQVQNIATEAKNVAESVRADADAGKFNGAIGPAGAAGGWYTPAVTQPDANTMRVSFEPSKEGMPAVADTDVKLPAGGGGSVPKPLTYDYMPEGYPTKAIRTATVMEEQVVEFVPAGDDLPSIGSLTTTFTPVEGQTYIVNWDGTEHECVCSLFSGRYLVLGNLSIIGAGDDTGEPFIYLNAPSMGSEFETFDTASSHTISVKKMGEIVTPMAEEFLPVASEDNYGAVKKSEVVSAYNFPSQVVHDQMVDAISAFKTGNASIVWNGEKVIDASYNSSDDTITVAFARAPLEFLTYTNVKGLYQNTLGSPTYGELKGSQVRITNDNNVYTVLLVEGESGSETLNVTAGRISIGSIYGISTTEMILKSSTSGSTKRFRITVDDSGNISATEVS